MKNKNSNNIREEKFQQVFSDAVHDIITAVPSWIVRWGITIVFIILSCVILFSTFVDFPIFITASVKVRSLNSPKTICTHQSARIIDLKVREGQQVSQNQILACLENNANLDDILKLEANLKFLQLGFKRGIDNKVEEPPVLNLGEVQAAYKEYLLCKLAVNDTLMKYNIKNSLDLKSQKFLNYKQSINRCIFEINRWLYLYVVRAPIEGKVSYIGNLQQYQNVNKNQNIFIVNPGEKDFFGEIQLSQYNMGKISIGQKAIVKLDSYPFEEYGIIQGKVTSVSDVAFNDSIFIARVNLQKNEDKNNGFRGHLKSGMKGEVNIIIEETTLINQFFKKWDKIL